MSKLAPFKNPHYKAAKAAHARGMHLHHRYTAPRDHERYQAVMYARWIAERDGIELPAPEPFKDPNCASVALVCYDEARVSGRLERRPRSVTFRGTRNVTVDLPHWDHVPVMQEHHE